MTIRNVPCYILECDHASCDMDTRELTQDVIFAGWPTASNAIDDWEVMGGVVLADGRSFCEEHAEPYANEPRAQVATQAETLFDADGGL